MRLKRLSQQLFDEIVAKTSIHEKTREIAYAVLVDGQASVDVAAKHGASKRRVELIVATIQRAYLKNTVKDVNSFFVVTGVWKT